MTVQVSCPACGGPVTFTVASAVVTVCPYCRSVVARGDRRVEDLGKVADLTDTGALLSVGLKGRYQGVPFELTGRAQLAHQAGGVWDEWYAHFADDRWGWLAEAQGRYYLTFRQTPFRPPPAFGELQLGKPARIVPDPDQLLVAEKGRARAASAEGQIPYRLEPGAEYDYADLSGPHGEFGTLDYSETPPFLFLGRELTADELGIPELGRRATPEPRHAEGVQINCPQCGGPLALRAPDRTERVVCPNCGGLLDARQGQLRFLQALKQPKVTPVIALGTTGPIDGHPYTVIGFLQRSIRSEGTKYFWEEYLLYNPRHGFRWLVRSDDHWSFVQNVPTGQVHVVAQRAHFRAQSFRLFQKEQARVEVVLGEFYWKVTAGEQVDVADFVRPPQMLSREVSHVANTSEIQWSLGTYLPPEQVERTFGVPHLPRPRAGNVAPNQPFPYKRVYAYWGMLSLAGLVLGAVMFALAPRRTVYERHFALPPLKPGEPPPVEFSPPFELHGRHNVEVSVYAPVSNTWVEVEGDLVNEQTGTVQSFGVPVEYYSGTDGGESWSEGSRNAHVYLSAPPAGPYVLRTEIQRERPHEPMPVDVRVRQGVPHPLPWVLAMLALAVVPACVAVYHIVFEHARWKDSAYSPYHKK